VSVGSQEAVQGLKAGNGAGISAFNDRVNQRDQNEETSFGHPFHRVLFGNSRSSGFSVSQALLTVGRPAGVWACRAQATFGSMATGAVDVSGMRKYPTKIVRQPTRELLKKIGG
jgi:hypothetical protein